MRADDLLVETITGLFSDTCAPVSVGAAEAGDTGMDAALWQTLEAGGLTLVGIPEDAGGSGGTWHDAAAIIKASGAFCAPVPVADTWAAARALAESGVAAVPAGPLGLLPVEVAPIRKVAWGNVATHVVVTGAGGAALVPASSVRMLDTGRNYAGEPWACMDAGPVSLSGRPVSDTRVDVLQGVVRALQMAGALQHVVDLSVRYANERQQFGRPIGKFQVLQHYLSEMAAEARAAEAAVDTAVDVLSTSGDEREGVEVVAIAKSYAGRATGVINRLAHQLHGAIGFTDEHRLQYATRRLWSWRDEHGTESEWAERLGRSLCAAGGDALWGTITKYPAASAS